MLDSLSLDWSCDWPQLWGKWNWQTFRFIHASVEVDSLLGQFELDAALLGFGLRFTWVFDHDTEMRREFADMAWLDNARVTLTYADYEALKAKAEAFDKAQEAGREHGA